MITRLAYDVSKGTSLAIVDTYARSLYLLGHLAEAVEHQGRAVGVLQRAIDRIAADEELEVDEERLEQLKNELRDLKITLKYYEDIARIRDAFKPSENGR